MRTTWCWSRTSTSRSSFPWSTSRRQERMCVLFFFASFPLCLVLGFGHRGFSKSSCWWSWFLSDKLILDWSVVTIATWFSYWMDNFGVCFSVCVDWWECAEGDYQSLVCSRNLIYNKTEWGKITKSWFIGCLISLLILNYIRSVKLKVNGTPVFWNKWRLEFKRLHQGWSCKDACRYGCGLPIVLLQQSFLTFNVKCVVLLN